MNPYNTLRTHWPDAPDIRNILIKSAPLMLISGENTIHTRGFYSPLSEIAKNFGDMKFWLLSLDREEHWVEFDLDDQEQDYFLKIRSAPDWAPGRPFPYSVRNQCFIGNGDWLLLTDRDDDRFYLLIKKAVNPHVIQLALSLAEIAS